MSTPDPPIDPEFKDVFPQQLIGPWDEGYALSVYRYEKEGGGYKYTRVGQSVYNFKYLDKSNPYYTEDAKEGATRSLTNVAAAFLRKIELNFDVIVSVPPNTERKHQPLDDLVDKIGQELGVERTVCFDEPRVLPGPTKSESLQRKHDILKKRYSISENQKIDGKTVLVVDDLIYTGVTLSYVTEALRNAGARKVAVLVMAYNWSANCKVRGAKLKLSGDYYKPNWKSFVIAHRESSLNDGFGFCTWDHDSDTPNIHREERLALEWYTEAARQTGKVNAKLALGHCYMRQGDKCRAYNRYKKLAKRDNPKAQYYLGRYYEKGEGGEVDAKKALEWYRKAAKLGHPDAQSRLSLFSETEESVIQASNQALE